MTSYPSYPSDPATFTPAERQVLLPSNAVANDCPWAVAFHTEEALADGAPAGSEVLAYPGVPLSLKSLDVTVPTLPVVPIRYARDGREFTYFSTVATLGTAQDITLPELRIECFFPAGDTTRENSRALAGRERVAYT